MAKIKYKGKDQDIKITNRVMMSFELSGGKLTEFETNPVTSAIKLACACLNLKGDPLEHADNFGSLADISNSIKDAMDESGLGEEIPEKNVDG